MSDERSLAELLRRCHRDELDRLAALLGYRSTTLGFSTLVEVLDRRLRRWGAHGFQNLVLRGGEGPPYRDLVRALARRKGVTPAGSLEETEVRLTAWAFRRAWQEVPEAERQELWRSLEMTPPAPEKGFDALMVAEKQHGRRATFLTAASVAGRVVMVANPLTGCLMPILGLVAVAWATRLRDDRLLPAVLEVGRLRQVVRHRVTVGVVGSPSSGKDAAIKAIFGWDTGNVNPVAGSTTAVTIHRLPGSTALHVVNTPGLGDVVQSVTDEAKEILDHIDLTVYLVNAQGGVQAREKRDYDDLVGRGRPVLVVVNKIDTLREDQRERYLTDARAKIGAPDDAFLAAAFDPLPQLAAAPFGVDAVRSWISARLVALGKDEGELPWEGEPMIENAREVNAGGEE